MVRLCDYGPDMSVAGRLYVVRLWIGLCNGWFIHGVGAWQLVPWCDAFVYVRLG